MTQSSAVRPAQMPSLAPSLSAILAVRSASQKAVAAAILTCAALALLATAPVGGDFWWPDAPRHALNGLFVRDLVAVHPFSDPVGWAIDYYLRRPALTIMFYPPLFYTIEAIAFALFGFSHLVAQTTVTAFIVLLGGATYTLAGSFLPRWSALGAALLAISMPETAFWGRQVMLDVPAYALVVASASCFLGYITSARPLKIYFAALLLLAAIYTKYNAGFIAPVLALTFLAAKGAAALRDRHAWIAAGLTTIGLVPAAILMVKFGGANVEAVKGLRETLPLSNLNCWLFYIKSLPAQSGIVVLCLAACGLPVVLRRLVLGRQWGAYVLLVAWLAIGYLVFSLISVKEPRHSIMVLLPLAITAPVFLQAILPKSVGEMAGLALGVCSFAYTLAFVPVPHVDGYKAVANYLGRNVPQNGVVLFSGYRDGNLLFNLAMIPDRPDITVIRLDKLLLSVPAGERRRGVTQSDDDEDEVAGMLRTLGAAYFVVQPDFWSDLPVMARFAKVVAGPDYRPVAHFDLTGATSSQDGTQGIDILRPTYPPADHPGRIDIDMPLAGRRFQGEVRH